MIMATLGMGKKSHLRLSRIRAGENAGEARSKRKIKNRLIGQEKFPGWLKGKCDQNDGDKWESYQPLPSSYSNSPNDMPIVTFLG